MNMSELVRLSVAFGRIFLRPDTVLAHGFLFNVVRSHRVKSEGIYFMRMTKHG